MISSQRLRLTLAYLESQYNASATHADPVVATLYCKMAVIELCGWVEQYFDSISVAAARSTTTTSAKAYLAKKVKLVYGMNYEKHCKTILLSTLGVDMLGVVEDIVEQNGGISRLAGELSTLYTDRNGAAHTHVASTSSYVSPSIVISKLNIIEPILFDIHALAIP